MDTSTNRRRVAMDIRKRVGEAKGLMAAFLLGALVSGYVLTTVTVQAAPVSRYAIAQSALHSIAPNTENSGGAQCPAGFSVTGGGIVAENAAFLRVLTSGPVVNVANVADTWVAGMYNEGSVQGSFRIYAICLRV